METEFAIQTDATNTVTTEGTDETSDTGKPLSAREQAMAAIEDQHAKSLQEQGVVFEGDTQDANDQATTETAVQTAAPVTTDPQPAERMLKVKIDGVEQELPESVVIKGFQKDSAASKRLEEAALLLKEVKEREQKLGQVAAPVDQAAAPLDGDATEIARKVFDSFTEGNIDDAVETLAKALTARTADSTPVVDESKLKAIVNETLNETTYEADFAKAKKMFDTDYADINASPRLAQLCNDIYFEQIEAGKLPSEAARLAGDEVRSLFPPAATPQTLANTRQERKQNIDNLTPAATVVAASSGQESPNDAAAVIAEMKRARGQT